MKRRDTGFTMVELVIMLIIVGIATTIAIPGFLEWLPGYRLKNAARDLYGNFQKAKTTAIKENRPYAIFFDMSANPGRYRICNQGINGAWDGGGGDDACDTVEMAKYKSDIDFGYGGATNDIPGNGSPPASVVTYLGSPKRAVLNPRGLSSAGYVYLQNGRNAAWGVGSLSSGVVRIRQWRDGDWQ